MYSQTAGSVASLLDFKCRMFSDVGCRMFSDVCGRLSFTSCNRYVFLSFLSKAYSQHSWLHLLFMRLEVDWCIVPWPGRPPQAACIRDGLWAFSRTRRSRCEGRFGNRWGMRGHKCIAEFAYFEFGRGTIESESSLAGEWQTLLLIIAQAGWEAERASIHSTGVTDQWYGIL